MLFGDLENESKFRVQKKLEKAMAQAPQQVKSLIQMEVPTKPDRQVDPENEKFVYKLLEHLDPTVSF